MDKPRILLWLDNAEACERALSRAGLTQRIETVRAPRHATPPNDMFDTIEAMLA
jgi:hypothetical protein